MTVLAEIVGRIRRGGPYPDHAKSLQTAVVDVLRRDGWEVDVEVAVPSRGSDGQRGRIDMVLSHDGAPVAAIELDSKNPRTKSLFKVRHHAAPVKLVVVRRHMALHEVEPGVWCFGVEVRS